MGRDGKELLRSMVGTWEGTYRLWLEPEVLLCEGPVRGTVREILGGTFVVHEYDYDVQGDPQQGHMVIAAPGGTHLTASWVDSWHNGDSILFCNPTGDCAVVGTYGPPEDPWSWRTEFDVSTPDELVVTAWNITPDGAEAKATESRYTRVGG